MSSDQEWAKPNYGLRKQIALRTAIGEKKGNRILMGTTSEYQDDRIGLNPEWFGEIMGAHNPQFYA
jgi:hypothetical protein